MATITPTTVKATDGGVFNVYIVTWAAIGNADTGTQVAMTSASDRSIQIEGTFASATITVQGSNDGVNWQTLSDPQGNAITATASKLKAILELTRFIRVISSGGAGTAVTATLCMRGQS